MDFTDKLQRLVQGKNKAELARLAGLSTETAVSNLLNRRSKPRADIALRLARALEVPLEWLVDDHHGWPPPRRGDPAAALPDYVLMKRVTDRYRERAIMLLDTLRQAERLDWTPVAQQLVHRPLQDEIPPPLAMGFQLAEALLSLYVINEFDPSILAGVAIEQHRPDVKSDEIRLENLRKRRDHLLQSCEPLKMITEWVLLRKMLQITPERAQIIEGERQELVNRKRSPL